jgi:phage-related protein
MDLPSRPSRVPPLKSIAWLGSSYDDLMAFPDDAQDEAGFELFLLQQGRDWKPMRDVGPGAAEIRVHTRVEHRVIYVARFEVAVYVLHCFEKRPRKKSRHDVEVARKRYAQIESVRRGTR